MSIEVLYEDNHLLAFNKPAGLPTMGAVRGESTLVEYARQYLRRKYDKPGNVYIGVVHRLDAVATGLVLMARTSKAAARLSRSFQQREVQKTYVAIVAGKVRPLRGRWCDWVVKDESQRRMRVVQRDWPQAAQASLRYRVCGTSRRGATSVLEIDLETGRKHQIRLQAAHQGHPVLGDTKYGSRQPFPQGIALHAHRLALIHPVRREPLQLTAPVPRYWPVQIDV